jgi:hypothetical protein
VGLVVIDSLSDRSCSFFPSSMRGAARRCAMVVETLARPAPGNPALPSTRYPLNGTHS